MLRLRAWRDWRSRAAILIDDFAAVAVIAVEGCAAAIELLDESVDAVVQDHHGAGHFVVKRFGNSCALSFSRLRSDHDEAVSVDARLQRGKSGGSNAIVSERRDIRVIQIMGRISMTLGVVT